MNHLAIVISNLFWVLRNIFRYLNYDCYFTHVYHFAITTNVWIVSVAAAFHWFTWGSR